MLNKLRVHATFFAIGEEERYFSAGTLLELRSGDVVGDHTETHPMMASMSAHEQHEELFEQIARIELLGGPRPRLFRPPYGSFNATTFKLLHKLHLLMVLWSTDTERLHPARRPGDRAERARGRPPGRDHPHARRRRRPLGDDRRAAGDHRRAAQARPCTPSRSRG